MQCLLELCLLGIHDKLSVCSLSHQTFAMLGALAWQVITLNKISFLCFGGGDCMGNLFFDPGFSFLCPCLDFLLSSAFLLSSSLFPNIFAWCSSNFNLLVVVLMLNILVMPDAFGFRVKLKDQTNCMA